ncbi:MAG: hypothetical protein LBC43_04580, partial [Bifidobacteriaceae bacterium]|nr:hypothetical protein [Bifidobacteriaceae bacterium]
MFSAGLASLALALTSLINIVPASAITINPDQYGVSVQTADNEWTSLNFLETPNSNRLSATVSLAGAANLLDQNWSVQITMPGVDPWTVSSYDPTKTFDIGEKTPGTRIELRLSASQTFTDGSKREIDRGTYLDVPSLPQLYFGVSRDGQSWETGFKLRDNISTGVLGFAGSLSWRSSSSSGTKSIPTTTNSAVHVPFTARNADDEYELSLQGTIYREDNGIKSNYYNFTTTETFAARAFPQCRVDDQVFPSSGIAIHEGNDDDPHRISSDYDLVCMQQLINLDPDPQEDSYLTSHTWQITSDIDLSAASATDPSGWTPIGANVDGLASITITGDQLRTIKGLKVAQDANYMGLFGWTGNIEAANLNLESFNVQGDEYVGALVGKTSKANINHVLASGTVSGTSTVAGLIGYLDSMVDQTLSNIVVYDGDLNVSLGGLIHAIYSTDTTIGGVTHYGNLYHWSGLNSASSGSFNPFVDDDQYSYPLNGKSTSCSDLTTISWWNQLGFPASTVNLPFRCLATLITSNSNLGNLSGAVGETLTYSDHTNTSVYRYPAKSSKVDFYVSNNPSAASKISDLTISNDQTSATILDAAGYLGTYVYSLGLDLPAGIALISDSNTLNATFADRGNDPYLKTFDLVNYANNDVGLTWEIDQSQADGSEATFKLIDPRGGVTPTTVPNKLSDTSKIGVKTQPGTYTIDATFKMPITGGGTATERQIKTFTTPLLSDFGFIASQDTSSDTLDLHYEFDQAVTGALNISASNLTDSSQFLTTTSEASREKAYAGLSIPMQMGNQYQAILDGSVTSQDASYSFYENRELTLASFSDFGITQKTLGDYTVTYALRNTVSQALQVSYSYFKKTGVGLSCDDLPDPDSPSPSYSGNFQCHTSPTNPQLDSLLTNFYPQAVGTITNADPSSGRLLVQSVKQWSEFTSSIYAPTSSKDCGYTFQTDNIAKHRGTAQDPYLIANVNDLNCMRQLINNQVGNFSQFHYW